MVTPELLDLIERYKEDLARSLPGCTCNFYLVAPDRREREVLAQFARPAFRQDLADIPLAFIPFGDLCTHRDALGRFGDDHNILRKMARVAPRAV